VRIQIGSWRDPEVPRAIKVLSVLGVAVVAAAIMPPDLIWVFIGPLAIGAVVALLIAARGGPRGNLGAGAMAVPHRGYNISRVPVAGFPGLVLVLGFIWIFWSGLPGVGPVLIGLALIGIVVGFALVTLSRRRRTPSSVLELSSSAAEIKTRSSGAESKGEQH